MKKILRIFAIELAGLYVASQIAGGLVFQNQAEGLVITAVGLGVAIYLVKPIINILLLPVNLATLGVFKFLAHTITLFVVDIALSQFEIVGFHFPGIASNLLDLPAINFEKGAVAYLAFSLIISLVTSAINWLRK
jgi:uncharacterized membrane protein YvlD (DUF360 family)